MSASGRPRSARSEDAGQMSFAGGAACSAAKHALEGLSEALADEVRPHGIRTLIVEPGAFRTELMGARYPARASSTRTRKRSAGRARTWTARAAPSPATRARPRKPSSPRSTPPTRRCGSYWAPTRWTPSAPSTSDCGRPRQVRGGVARYGVRLARLTRSPERRWPLPRYCGEQIRRRLHGHSTRHHDPGCPGQSR